MEEFSEDDLEIPDEIFIIEDAQDFEEHPLEARSEIEQKVM